MTKFQNFKNFHSQCLFFSKQTKKISFLEIARSLGINERSTKQYTKKDLESDSTIKAFAQLNRSKQGSLKFLRLINQIGASL